MTDTTPGTFSTAPQLVPDAPPAPDDDRPRSIGSTGGLPGGVPVAPPKPDEKPKRPTTRAGRAAAAAAKKAAKADKAEKAPKASTTPRPRKATLETRLTGSLVTLGTVVAATGGMTSPAITADGVLICQHAPNVAAALDKVAKDDPRVAAALERMLTVGTWSGLVAAMLPLVLGIAANHGAIPANVAAMLGAEAPAAPAPEHGQAPEPGPLDGLTGFPVV